MSIHENHPFHIVNKRPRPLIGAIGAIVTLIGLINWFHQYDDRLLWIGAIITVLTIIQWWRDVTREGTYQGLHTKIVTKVLRWGIILFIISEVLFFMSCTGCPRRNVPDFGRVFLMLKYTDITQNTYIQSWTVTEIIAREVWNFDSCSTLIDYQIHIKTGRNMLFL